MSLIGVFGPITFLSCWMTAIGSESHLPLSCIPPSYEDYPLETLSGLCYSSQVWSFNSEINMTYDKAREENYYEEYFKVDKSIDVGHMR